MAMITKITTQKHSDERFNIYLDDGSGERYGFSVDQDILIKFNLKKGKQLDELTLVEIQYGDEVKKAYNKAIEFLSYRMRSAKEVEDYLKKQEYSEVIIQEVIMKLKNLSYLNDLEFAIAYIRTQWRTNGKGPTLIKRELSGKGVDHVYIEEALAPYNETFQIEEAVKHIEKLLKKNTKTSTHQLKQKIEQHLLRKGFSFHVISIAFEEINVEQEESEEWEALQKQAEKGKRKYETQESQLYNLKMKQFLYRKGFSIEMIEKYLNNEE